LSPQNNLYEVLCGSGGIVENVKVLQTDRQDNGWTMGNENSSLEISA
jgi:hypothetical protein